MNAVKTSDRWHILVFANGYPPRQIAGAEQQIARKARWWAAKGHRVTVFAADPYLAQHAADEVRQEEVELVDGIPVHRIRFAAPDASRPLSETFRHPGLEPVVERAISELQPDLVYQVSGYLFGVIPILKAARVNVPSALFALDYWHTCPRITLLQPSGANCPGPRGPADCAACRLTARRPAMMLGRAMNHQLWRVAAGVGAQFDRTGLPDLLGVHPFRERADAISLAIDQLGLVICNSVFLEDQLKRLGVPSNKIARVRQGIAPVSRPNLDHKQRRAVDSELRVLYLGQITWHKGVDLLFAAAGQLLDERISISVRAFGPQTAGAVNLPRSVRPHLASGALQIHPPINAERIADELAAADVLVAPSRWYENSPNVILEAQLAGLPVVTADLGGMAEMVRHEVDGLLVAPNDVESLARALRRLAIDRELLDRLRAGVRPPHSIDVEMEAEQGALRRLLASQARR